MKVESTLFFFASGATAVDAGDVALLYPFVSGTGGLQTCQIRG
jgi:hypothetical protein